MYKNGTIRPAETLLRTITLTETLLKKKLEDVTYGKNF
jgi:hypothetical protein